MSSQTRLFAEVLLPFAVPGTYTYEVPNNLIGEVEIGKRTMVEFGRGAKMFTGLVVKLHNNQPDLQTKYVHSILDVSPIINQSVLNFWKWISEYYLCTPGEVMSAALPGILNLSSESKFKLNDEQEVLYDNLNEKETTVVRMLENKITLSLKDITKLLSLNNPMPVIKKMLDRSIILDYQEIKNKTIAKKETLFSLSQRRVSAENMNELVIELGRAPKQLQAFMKIIELSEWDGENSMDVKVSKKNLVSSGITDSSIKALLKKELIDQFFEVENRIKHNQSDLETELKPLNSDQESCLQEIKKQFKQNDVILLHGVTSSGKTEVYAHLIREVIEQKRQVLILLPEIALTTQLIARFKTYFGERVTVYHSRLSQNERAEVWNLMGKFDNSDGQIILGARSSIFLPFSDLGLIVVDEEHDRSFKQQDPAPRYEARDLAVVLAKIHHGKVLLGSATPSLESFENTLTGKYGYVVLNKRFGGFNMPEIITVDLTAERKKKRLKASFSVELIKLIEDTTSSGEQVILFHNRRGYAPLLICDQCSFSPKCKHCDVFLTHHKSNDRMTCHYCGYSERVNTVCPECQQGNLKDVGAGTEKIEEEMEAIFPNLKLARFDLDSTRKKHAFSQILSKFKSGDIDVLIGTQMVTKGLDFENVGLVGIINADQMLRFPDFRSFERTFQALTQVSGRAGRNKKRGKVVIQTFDPSHPIIQHVISGDYNNFVAAELAERKAFKYPPFFRLLYVFVKHHNRQKVYEASQALLQLLQRDFKSNLIGPEFPIIERIRNDYAMQFVLKLNKSSMAPMKRKLNDKLIEFNSNLNFGSVKTYVDVDPY